MTFRGKLKDGTVFIIEGAEGVRQEEDLVIIKTKELECCIFSSYVKNYKMEDNMGTFECKLKDGNRYVMTGVTEVSCDGDMLRVITKTFNHFVSIGHIEKYKISF